MSKQDKPNYKEGLKQIAKNVAAAGAGTAVGYYGGGFLAKKVTESKRFRDYYRSLPAAKRKALSDKIRAGGAIAGSAAGGLSSYALSNAFNKKKEEEEKVASFCIELYTRIL